MIVQAKKKYVKVILCFLAFVILFVGGYFLLRALERTDLYEGFFPSDQSKKILHIGEEDYQLRDDLTTLLLIGVDKTGEMKAIESNINDGQSDFLSLIVFDQTENTYSILQLNRDTMTPVPMLGIGGMVVGELEMQLALAHTYGDGMEESCDNTVAAVRNFLCGAPIDHYFAINMSGISTLVDAMGGVNVTIREDFSEIDPSLVQGETMLLDGEKCVTYLRGRQGVGDQSNLSRMERQKDFIRELIDGMTTEETSEMSSALSESANYMLTDLTVNRLSDFLEDLRDASFTGIESPAGEAIVGEEFMEFYADEQSVNDLVIRLFCKTEKE